MTVVSVCMSVLGTITHSLCICHVAIKLYFIVLYCIAVLFTLSQMSLRDAGSGL